MPELYYKDALKMAQKEYKSCVAKGIYPYLQVLDELLPPDRANRGVNLGIVQIPAEFIVGTRHAGRTNSFSRSFLPLLADGTEFSDKWKHLCQSHLEEGIRDPIKVCEYMNRFYVEEGNKRVSVLKFFSAVSIPAQVTRILPKRDGSKQVEIYYEFVDFYRLSKVNYLEFTKQGSYAALQKFMGKEPDEPWSDDDRSGFATAYHYFRQAYEKSGGKRLSSTVGDAMLAFIKVYGYSALRGKTAGEIRKQVSSMWEEIKLQQEEAPIDIKLAPEEEKKPGLLTKVLSSSEPKGARVAFIHDKNPDTSGWTRGHEEGRQHVQEVFGEKLLTAAYFDAMDGDPLHVIKQAIAEGATTIFTTSPRLLPASLRAAVEHPEVTILNCSLNKSHRYIRTYYARMYEAKFVSGAVAGALSMSDNVGYICDYPIYGQIAGINAFALGAQMVNPRARVCLEWSSVGGAEEALRRLTSRGVRIISSQDLTKQGDEWRTAFGLSLFTGDRQVHLVKPIWQWGAYYEAMIRRIYDKSLQSEYAQSSKALNYYWGMSAGVIDVQCSDRVPEGTRRLVELLQRGIRAGACNPFCGPLYTQDGRVIDGEDHLLSPEQIIGMDWLVENVDGEIPRYGELSETGKATVDMVGVEPSTKEKQ